MNAKPAWHVVPPAAVGTDTAPHRTPEGEQPRRQRGLRALRSEVRARLLCARALESLPPERYGFSVDAATWLFLITSAIYRWYFRTQCFGLEDLPSGPVLLVANHGSHALGVGRREHRDGVPPRRRATPSGPRHGGASVDGAAHSGACGTPDRCSGWHASVLHQLAERRCGGTGVSGRGTSADAWLSAALPTRSIRARVRACRARYRRARRARRGDRRGRGGAPDRQPGLVASPRAYSGGADHALRRDAAAGTLPSPLRRPIVVARRADAGPRHT